MSDEHERQEPPPDLLERSVSWVSAALILALVGFLTWEALQQSSPPAISVRAGTPWQAESSYYLPLEVHNTGGLSVQNLQIRVRLTEGQQDVETAEAGLSWLPAQSSRRVVAILEHDPRNYELQIQPKGYEEP